MGKRIIIKGADFSQVAVLNNQVVKTCEELLTDRGFYHITRTNPKTMAYEASGGTYYSAIIPLHPNMYVETAIGLIASSVGTSGTKDIPCVAFLSGGSMSDFIQGSQIYATNKTDGVFASFSGILNPPANATHVLINTNTGHGGSLNAIISWAED